ncbi:MAG: DUF554 domain-containing protein [Prevotella sp.]|nr:DUF554 domain-containing protein [Prevotella sp.]
MLGTIVNTCTIIVGSVVGALLNRGIKEKYKNVLYTGLGLACLAIGLNATVTNLPKSQYPVLFIVAISIGGVIGTALDIDGRFKRRVDKLTRSSLSETKKQVDELTSKQVDKLCDSVANNSSTRQLVNSSTNKTLATGLSTAVLVYCIGPLSMLGPVISALKGDNTFLYTNATLDLVSSVVFASTYGIGMILAAPVLFLWQGLFYLVASLSSQAVSEALMAELLIVGGMMITASGLSLLNLKDCKTLNYLPALLVPVVWFLVV